ncbi:hypothetical protein [Sulfurimonas sp.]
MVGFRTNIKINNNRKELLIWCHIFKQWQKINRDYLEDSNFQDSLYWYNERANISCLAGAIWKIGGYALEEYTTVKGEDKKYGRTDLYFSIDEIAYIIEAKHQWLQFNTKNKNFDSFKDEINCYLSEAVKDCENSMLNENVNNGVGLVFITPYWKTELDKYQELKSFENELLKKDYDIIGTFAINVKNIDDENNLNSNYGNTCNAVYIIGKYLSKDEIVE